ncbi:hypothetical protein BJX96DRAFT_171498 [Aspergillus floccosus]
MRFLNRTLLGVITASTLTCSCLAQKPSPYTDSGTGIAFTTWNIPLEDKTGDLTFGMALPSNALKADATEFIGYINYTAEGKTDKDGWTGIALGGSMKDSLLLVAYPDGDDMRTSLRFTTKYSMPVVYTGHATVTQITHAVNPSGYSLIFHCEDCLHWSQDGASGNASTSSGEVDLGFAHSGQTPGHAGCPKEATLKHHDHSGTWTAVLDESATGSNYDKWKGMGKSNPSDKC